MRQIVTLALFCFWGSTLFGQDMNKLVEAPFDQLLVAGNIHLILQASHKQALEFEGDQNLDGVTVESKDGVLLFKTKSDLKKEPPRKGRLYYKALKQIEVKKGALVQCTDTLRTETLSLKAETGGKAELRVLTDSLSARVNQGADLILYGKTRAQFVNAYTWGNYLAYDLHVESSYVKAATGAQVKVNAFLLLNSNATSKATVGYWGEPQKKEIKTSVGGVVIQLNE